MTLRLTLIAIALLWLATRRQRRLHVLPQFGPRPSNDWTAFARRRPLDWPPQPEDWNAFHRVLAHLQLAEQPGIVWLNAVSDPLGRVYVDGQRCRLAGVAGLQGALRGSSGALGTGAAGSEPDGGRNPTDGVGGRVVTTEQKLAAVAAGWRTAQRYGELSSTTVVIAGRFSEPCVQFGYDLYQAKLLVEAQDGERRI